MNVIIRDKDGSIRNRILPPTVIDTPDVLYDVRDNKVVAYRLSNVSTGYEFDEVQWMLVSDLEC